MAEAQKAGKFRFELVSPEEIMISEPVELAVVPGEEGDFGVMAGHAPLLSSLRAGVVTVTEGEGKEPRRIFVAGGFADVTGDQCTVLAEEAVALENIGERSDLEQAIKDLTEDLGLAEDDQKRAHVEQRLLIAKAKLQAATGELVI